MKPSSTVSDSDQSLKLAIAIALLRYKKLNDPPPSSSAAVLLWKKKAEIRKRELQRLREELKQLEDAAPCEVVQQIASCRCHFFDGIGVPNPKTGLPAGSDGTGRQDHWIDDVLRRRFLRLVRQKERKRKLDGFSQKRHYIEFNGEDEIDRLSTSIDFLVELPSSTAVGDSSFAALSHQAVDFILASMKNLLSLQKGNDLIEEIVNGLIMRLTKRMCSKAEREGSFASGSDAQFYFQHLIRKLGNEPFIGQRIMLLVSQRISIEGESLLFMDPFDEAFTDIHDSLFMMIQLLELLISDYVHTWTRIEDLDLRLLEEWVRSVLHARKSLGLLEGRNSLYMLYIDRVTGELSKEMVPLVRQGKLDQDIVSNLFC